MLVWLLCVLPAIAGWRNLMEGEKDALFHVWGVRDMPSLVELEDNPKKFWVKRKKELFEGPGKLLTHLDFCTWFLSELKDQMAQKFKEVKVPPWFAEPDAIEDVLREFLVEDQVLWPAALVSCYALAYDYTLLHITKDVSREKASTLRTSKKELFSVYCSRKAFQICTQRAAQKVFTPMPRPGFDILRWKIVPGGLFSFFDSLVTRSEGYQLCSISPNPEDWLSFCAHDGIFQLCSGIQDHDVFTHARNAYRLAQGLKQHGISDQAQFDACCNPDALSGDLITMSHQVQAWFTQFHEAPSQCKAFYKESLMSLLFPGRSFLSDSGLREITPYFVHLPLDYNWRVEPLSKADLDDDAIQGALLSWRGLYCFPSFRFFPKRDAHLYNGVLEKDLRYLREPDLMRAPHFIRTVINDLCALDGRSDLVNSPEKFESFLKRGKALAKKVLDALDEMTQRVHHLLMAKVPYYVYFLSITFYAGELCKLRNDPGVLYLGAQSHFGVFDENDKCLMSLAANL